MTVTRRLRAATLALVPLVGLGSLTAIGPSGAAADEPEPAEVALAWQSIAQTTIPFSPAKSLYLAFTSEAVDKAVRHSSRASGSSEAAAVAQAAHDVLVAYFPGASATLAARLAETLAGVPDGPAEHQGIAIGAEVAAEQVAARAADGRNDPTVVYSAAPGIGVWTDARPMATPWYGLVDRIAGGRPVRVDGPDPVGSPAYRADLAEVQAVGRAGDDAARAATATFFNVDAFAMYRHGLIAHLRANPISLASTTALFADLDVASAEALRQVWRLKLTEGFWRPVVAITSDDGDPLTTAVPGWSTVLPTPPYPEYPSGHGAVTGSFAEAVRCHLGEIPLTINGAGGTRTYPSLAAMEQDAFMSRIWGGIHFRDGMDDAYAMAHTIAQGVCD